MKNKMIIILWLALTGNFGCYSECKELSKSYCRFYDYGVEEPAYESYGDRCDSIVWTDYHGFPISVYMGVESEHNTISDSEFVFLPLDYVIVKCNDIN